jgi:inositol-pentakisphosphate 2-kinase
VVRDVFGKSLARPLLQTKILRILSDLQRNLDLLDIEGLSKLWKEAELAALEQHVGSVTPLGGKSRYIQISDPGLSDWTEVLDIYTSSRRENLDHTEPSIKDLRYYLLAHLLSATFKDCSIIVRLDFLRLGDDFESDVGPDSVVVIDLDPKSMNKLKGWEELDREIVTAYAPAERKVCVDANQVDNAL